MNKKRLRPMTTLEEKLRKEKIAHLEALMDQEGVNIRWQSSKKVVEAANGLSSFFEAIGYTSTPEGVMMRVEDDILDADRPRAVQKAIDADWSQVERALRNGDGESSSSC